MGTLETTLQPFVRNPRTREVSDTEDLDAIAEMARGTALILLETLSVLVGSNGLDENSNSDMGPLVSALNRIAGRTRCSMVLLHHVAKGYPSGESRLPGPGWMCP